MKVDKGSKELKADFDNFINLRIERNYEIVKETKEYHKIEDEYDGEYYLLEKELTENQRCYLDDITDVFDIEDNKIYKLAFFDKKNNLNGLNEEDLDNFIKKQLKKNYIKIQRDRTFLEFEGDGDMNLEPFTPEQIKKVKEIIRLQKKLQEIEYISIYKQALYDKEQLIR